MPGIICRFYIEGHCKKGDQCDLDHIDNVCRSWFRNGHCNRENCHFDHIELGEKREGGKFPKHNGDERRNDRSFFQHDDERMERRNDSFQHDDRKNNRNFQQDDRNNRNDDRRNPNGYRRDMRNIEERMDRIS